MKYKATVYDGVATVVRHEYDDQNRLKNFDYFTHYTYDKTRISRVQTNGTYSLTTAENANAQYSYEPDGKLKRVTYPKLTDGSLLTSDYVYDGIGRLLKVTNKKGTTILSEYQYQYDANGNITAVTDATGTTSYQYDKLDRLIQVKRPSGQTIVYTYDVRGNRKTLKGDSLIEDSKEQTYTFNVWDQLKTVTKENVTTEFEYEMQGLRLSKTTTTTPIDGSGTGTPPTPVTEKVRYAYNNSGQVISESDAHNQAIANYVWGPDRMLAKRDVATNKKYYYLYNGHGDVVQIVDENGTKVNSYQYDEWGNILAQEEGIRNSFKYAGEILDQETGLYYLRARYYNPEIGRFVSKDTYEGNVTNPLSQNLYTYVHNNPLIFVDPSGHNPVGPGNGASFDANQWKYLSALAQSENSGLAKWANNQIKQELYYKSSTSSKSSETVNKKSTTVAVPTPVVGKATSGISLLRSVGTVGLGILVSISGSSSEKQREEQHTYYRALEKRDVDSLVAGKGIVAGNVNANMTVLSHVLTGDSKNSPWISTTKYVSVARKYDSGYGIVAIDFRKVTSKKVYAPLEIPDNGIDTNEWARELAIRDQEWLVYQYIPQSAIKGFVK